LASFYQHPRCSVGRLKPCGFSNCSDGGRVRNRLHFWKPSGTSCCPGRFRKFEGDLFGLENSGWSLAGLALICGILRLVWNLWDREPWGCAVRGWAFGRLGLGSSQPFLMGEVKWINYTRYSINLNYTTW
jgi:hypothetical protein